jgi:TonB family protein
MGVVRLRSSLSLSLMVHALIMAAWAFLFAGQAANNAKKSLTWIEVDPAPRRHARVEKKAEDHNSNRIVQTASGFNTERAAPDAFLGERTQVVERQTVGKTKSTVIGGSSAVQKIKSQTKPEGPLVKYGIPIFRSGKLDVKTLTKQDQPQWASSDGVAQDYVKGLKESDQTALNTKEYVFYGYFQRIRERLDLAWTRALREQLIKLYRSGRHLASDVDHRTRTIVTLDARGEIIRIQLIEESGVRDLDDAAVKAFNAAGPFPNPPHGIVDKSGTVQIRWDFVLKT